MKTRKQIEQQIDDINNKICPNEIEEAVAYLYAQVLKLQDENSELKDKLSRLKWTLMEQD
jgi:peptidoglycan hydrolase CwlO-like protein